jgi:hypothetical protein
MKQQSATWLCTAAFAALLGACATSPTTDPTVAALYRAENSIRAAQQDRAADFAAFELTSAQSKLIEAQQLAAQSQDKAARERAEESLADAQLAAAKSDLAQTLDQGGRVQRNFNGIQTMPAPGAR